MSAKRKAPAKIAQPIVKQTVKSTFNATINEADTAVSAVDTLKTETNGVDDHVIEISSDSGGSSEYELSDEEEAAQANGKTNSEEQQRSNKDVAKSLPTANGDADIDMPSPDLQPEGESDQEAAAPTFGDLVRANETIDVPSAISAQPLSSTVPSAKAIAPPSLASLGTVLSQALRTDDADLLESCLHTTDLTTIRNTIQRLDSSLAGVLLTKLASRMYRRPGRAGSLMTWVQWTLIAHGGALATQPGLVKKLSELNRVLEERSRGLSSLLALKGKLDLLEAQMSLRRNIQRTAGSDEEDVEDGEEGIVYVEGEESDAEIANADIDIEDDEDDVPVTNGLIDDDDDDDDDEHSDEEEEEEEEDEVIGEEDLDENEVDHDDVESLGEDEDSEVDAPPAKKSKARK